MVRMRGVKPAAVLIAIVTLLCPASFTQSEGGTVCVAPIPENMPATSAPGLGCASNSFSLRIDAQSIFSWPTKKSVRIDGLDLRVRHSVAVYCDGKPQQYFRFRFSEFKATELCLFLNDLYKTAQLWDPNQNPAPWCKCKRSL
jgi:hypothetical protein